MAAYSGCQPELQLKRRCAELTNAQHIQAATQTCERVKDGGLVYVAGAGFFKLKRRIKSVFSRLGVFFILKEASSERNTLSEG